MGDDDGELPPHLLWFLQAAAKAPTINDGFDLEKVRYVEAAWEFVDGDLASFGWVVAMRVGS